jgi:error-prone DNA polymerase
VHEAQRRGMTVLPPHVARSDVECRVEDGAVRIGLGYVQGVREEEVKALVAERECGGRYRDAGDLAARSGAGRDTLERLAWAGACDDLPRREALWQMGVVTPGRAVPGGVQLSLPLPAPAAPGLRELSDWERMLADYGSFRISIAEHPMALMRPELPEAALSSRALARVAAERRVTVAGLVVARQRPATANGVTFMLLEDEFGTMNLVVAPPVYQRHRLAVRAEPFVIATGRLERRTGTINVVVDHIAGLERPDLPLADVKHIEPPADRETGRPAEPAIAAEPEEPALAATAAGDLRAVLPAPHSFGRRGR